MEQNDKQTQEQTSTDNNIPPASGFDVAQKYKELRKEHDILKAEVAALNAARLEQQQQQEKKQRIEELKESILGDPETKRKLAEEMFDVLEEKKIEGLKHNEKLFDHVFKTFRRAQNVYRN